MWSHFQTVYRAKLLSALECRAIFWPSYTHTWRWGRSATLYMTKSEINHELYSMKSSCSCKIFCLHNGTSPSSSHPLTQICSGYSLNAPEQRAGGTQEEGWEEKFHCTSPCVNTATCWIYPQGRNPTLCFSNNSVSASILACQTEQSQLFSPPHTILGILSIPQSQYGGQTGWRRRGEGHTAQWKSLHRASTDRTQLNLTPYHFNSTNQTQSRMLRLPGGSLHLPQILWHVPVP